MRLSKRFVRVAIRLAALGLLGAIGLLTFLGLQHNKEVLLPAPTGPYAVGRVGYDWVDEARSETLTKSQNTKRELLIWVWYPAAPTQPGAAPAGYMPQKWGEVRERDLGPLAFFLIPSLAATRVHAIADAAVSPARRTYPVLIMEPGLGSIATDYTTLAEDLASHGYIVVGITPTYSAHVVVFPDGRVARRTDDGNPPDAASAEESQRILDRLITVWAADDIFVLNQLEKLNTADPLGKFANRLDLRTVGVLGHSFGGAAAAEACRLDPRFKAGIDIDGSPYGDVIQTGLAQPFMFILAEHANASGAEAQSLRDIQRIYSSLPHGGCQVTIQGARHINFSDYAIRYQSLAGMILKARGAFGSIDGQRGLAITADYVRAFFDCYLQGSDEPLLKGASPQYPEVQFEMRQ